MIQVTFYRTSRTHLNPFSCHIDWNTIIRVLYECDAIVLYSLQPTQFSGGGPALHLSHLAITTRYPKYAIKKGKHTTPNKLAMRESCFSPNVEIMKHTTLSRRRNILRSGKYAVLASVSSVAMNSLSVSLVL